MRTIDDKTPIAKKLIDLQSTIGHTEKRMMFREFYYKKNHFFLFLCTILLVVTPLFLLIYELNTPFNIFINNPLSVAGIFIMMISSFLMLGYGVFAHFIKVKNVIERAICLSFYSIIIVSVFLMTIGHNRDVSIFANEHFVDIDSDLRTYFLTQLGVYLPALCLFAFCIAPLPEKSSVIVLLTIALAECVLPSLPIFKGHEFYPLIQQLIAHALFIICYYYFYRFHKSNFLLEFRLESLSYLDQMTNCLNRNAFSVYVQDLKEGKNRENIGVILFDIDDFKIFNDEYSHAEGDKILKKVVDTVYSVFDKSKKLLFRYGGEEFIILIPNASLKEVIKTASDIKDAMRASNQPRSGTKYPSLSVTLGCGVYDIKEDFVAKVDKQMYIGKNNNKNCVVCDDKIVY